MASDYGRKRQAVKLTPRIDNHQGAIKVTNHTAETSALIYARVAGFAYVLTTVLGVINNFFIAPELS
jgi:hypothetical protein